MSTLFESTQNSISECFSKEKLLRETPESTVCLLRHHKSRKRYVLREFSGDAEAMRRLIGIRCAHLPIVYEAASNEGRVLVLEEYIPGDNLAELILSAPLTQRQVRGIVLDLCDALYVLHTLGLVHRDVKPENVILNGDSAVLIDFNTMRKASPEKDSPNDTRILGTLGYAPPEQYGLSQTDCTADIYALGVLINVLLTGKHPSLQLARGRWGHIVTRCTMTNPRKRYPSVQAVREAL